MSIRHSASDPPIPTMDPLALLANLRESARRLTSERIAAELAHQAEEQKRDALVQELRAAAGEPDQDATRDLMHAVAKAQGYVDQTEAALETARANEETADLAVRDLSRKVWA